MSALINEAAGLGAFVLRNFLRILPFLLVTVPLSVVVRRSGVSNRIRKVLGRSPLAAVALATLFGALSPFCSCGVIPVIAALLAAGVPLAPVMSFWLASPSMDPEILFMSAGMIGWDLALWRFGATLLLSFGAGLAVMLLERRGYFAAGFLRDGIRPPAVDEAEPGIGVGADAAALSPAGGPATVAASRPVARLSVSALALESARITWRFVLLMAVAFVLEALIVRFVPARAVAAVLGGNRFFAVPLATLVGIPLYTTNLSALGVISGLLAQGMDPGAALAFLVGGAVTTIPAMSAVFGVVRRRVFVLYVGFAVAGSLLAGFAFRLAHL